MSYFCEARNEIREEIISATGYINIYSLIFRKAAEYEAKYNKDISEFSIDEAKEYLTGIDSCSLNTLKCYSSLIKNYADECIDRKLNSSKSGWHLLNQKIIQECVNSQKEQSKIITEEELQRIIVSLPNACDQFFLRALFEGFKGIFFEDIHMVSIDDFDLEKGTVNLPTHRTVQISPILADYVKKSSKTYEYDVATDLRVAKIKFDPDCDRVFKWSITTTYPNDMIRAKARIIEKMRSLKDLNGLPDITIPRIYNSGLFNAVKVKAERENVNMIEVLSNEDLFKGIRNQYMITTSLAQLRNRYMKFI